MRACTLLCIPPKDEKYSSQRSKEAGSEETEIACDCGHPDCAMRSEWPAASRSLRCRTRTGGIRKALLGILLGFGPAGVCFNGDFNLDARL